MPKHNKEKSDKKARKQLNELLKSVLEENQQVTQNKKRFRLSCAFLMITFLIAATVVKFLLLDKFITGISNIILTFWLFLAAIVLSFLISLYWAGIGISSIIGAIVLGRLDLIGINASRESMKDLKKHAKSIQRVDAKLSEVNTWVKGSGGNSRTIVDVVFDCRDGVHRKFSVDPHDGRVSGKHYESLDDDSHAFVWHGVPLVPGDKGVLSYNPEYNEKGFRGFYNDMTVADFERISKLKAS